MNPLVVFSTEDQYRRFVESGRNPQDFTVFCDNERFYDFLENKRIGYLKIEEYSIRESWQEINQWSCARAASWSKICREGGIVDGVDYFSANYLHLCMALISIVKNLHFARWVFRNYEFDEIVVFEEPMADYPALSGNAFLNLFLNEEAGRRKISRARLAVWPEPKRKNPKGIFLRRWAERVCSVVSRPGKGLEFMVYGSLRHLSSTARALKKKGMKLFIYDDCFHKDIFFFALRERIPYILERSFGEHESAPARVFEDFYLKMRQGIGLARKQRHFVFGTYDLSDLMETKLLPSMEHYAEDLERKARRYEGILRTCPIKGLIVEEDFASRAFLAAYLKARGVQSFCLSHANLALDHDPPQESYQQFSQSRTFVNSRHEIFSYVNRGWDSRSLVVTGTPRYDRLVKMAASRPRAAQNNAPFQILHCASMLTRYSPRTIGYAGCDIYDFGESQEEVLRALLEAAKGLPVAITVKPHYTEEEVAWADFAGNLKTGAEIRVVRACEDFFSILVKSHAIVLSNWSSTLMEAAIARVPSFYVDLKGQQSKQISQLASAGFCLPVRSVEELRRYLALICEKKGDWDFPAGPEARDYYLGKEDGLATERAAKFITEKLSHAA